MKLISWNVNGLRAVIKKGFKEFFEKEDADIFCIQETKMQQDQIDDEIKSLFSKYNCYWNSAIRKDIQAQQYLQNKSHLMLHME